MVITKRHDNQLTKKERRKTNVMATKKLNRNTIHTSETNERSIRNTQYIRQLIQHIVLLSKKENIHFASTKKERAFENKRKLFHLLGLVFPVATLNFNATILLCMSVCITIILVVADYKNWASFLRRIPRGNLLIGLFREHELIHGQLCGLSWIFIAYTIILCSYEKYLVAMAMSVLIISDATAAIIGKNFGKHKICYSKTLEGSMMFFFSGLFVIALFLYKIIPATAFFNIHFLVLALIFSTIVELVAKNILLDDNFAIPLTFCSTYKILETIFYGNLLLE